MSESEAEVLLNDLDNKRAPKGLPRRRGKRPPPIRAGVYLARKTLAFLRDAFDQDKAREAWESESTLIRGQPDPSTVDVMELRETARDILLQRSTADRRAAPEWQEALRDNFTAFKWLDDATAWQMESRQTHGTCQLPREGLFLATDPPLKAGGTATVHSLRKATQHNGHHGTLLTYDDDVGRWQVKLSSGETIRVRPANLAALDDYHPLLLTPTALDDPANIRCLSPGPLWWSNAILDLQDDLHTVMAEIERAGVTDGLTFQAPRVTLEPGRPTDRQLGRPTSMRYINGRKLRTVGDYRNLSPAERAYLDDQERCWTGFGWPGRDRDRRPAWRPRPVEGYPLSDGLRCSVPATALVQCPALISLLRHQWTPQGWDDPLQHPDLHRGGRVEEDCSEAFDDVEFQEWYFDQA